MTGRFAVIVGVNAEDGNSYDMVMLDTGARITGVKHLSKDATARSGSTSVLDIPDRGDAKWDIAKYKPEETIRAIVGTTSGGHFIHGFLPPEIGQMDFKDPKLQVQRHNSDVLSLIDGEGNIQVSHPGGAYIRIGETPDNVDLTGKDVDGKFKIDRNTGRKVNIRVALAGNVVVLTMTPEGAVTFKLDNDFGIEAGGSINMKAVGDVNIEAGGGINAKAGGNIVLDSVLVENPNGDMTASGVSLVNHPHEGVKSGDDESGPPLPESS